MFQKSILKIEKYKENLSSKKRQRTDILSIERSGVDLEKVKSQLRGSPRDMVNARLEQRPKNVALVKRVRTSVADMRVCIWGLFPFLGYLVLLEILILYFILYFPRYWLVLESLVRRLSLILSSPAQFYLVFLGCISI